MSGTSDPTAFADRLAEIREFRAQLSGKYVLAEGYAEDVDTLLAAYDALAVAVLEYERALHAAPNRDITPAESAALYGMLALARAGQGRTG